MRAQAAGAAEVKSEEAWMDGRSEREEGTGKESGLLALSAIQAGWESERGWGVPLGAAPSQSASLRRWAGEGERVGDDIDTLPRSEASGRAADSNLAAAKRQPQTQSGPSLPVQSARASSQTFLGLFLHYHARSLARSSRATQSQSVSWVRGAAAEEKGA